MRTEAYQLCAEAAGEFKMMKNPVFAGGPIADENTFTASYRLWKNRIKKAKNVDKSVDKVD
jgi:hypothetical protein